MQEADTNPLNTVKFASAMVKYSAGLPPQLQPCMPLLQCLLWNHSEHPVFTSGTSSTARLKPM